MKCQISRSKIKLRLGHSETMKSSICIVNQLAIRVLFLGCLKLRVCIFEIVKATELYFTFLETSNLYLFRGQAPKDMEAL